MALLTSEIQRIRFELGYNVETVGAEPYISYVAVFNQIVQQFLEAGATTTSSTAVAAPATPGLPSPVAVTLANATGFSAGDLVFFDVDARQEAAHVQAISGSVITVLLTLAHTGTYPVTVDGGETIVREQLANIRRVEQALLGSISAAGIKKADEVEFFQFGAKGSARRPDLEAQREYYRDELASALGVQNLRRLRRSRGGGAGVVLY